MNNQQIQLNNLIDKALLGDTNAQFQLANYYFKTEEYDKSTYWSNKFNETVKQKK